MFASLKIIFFIFIRNKFLLKLQYACEKSSLTEIDISKRLLIHVAQISLDLQIVNPFWTDTPIANYPPDR